MNYLLTKQGVRTAIQIPDNQHWYKYIDTKEGNLLSWKVNKKEENDKVSL